MSNGPSDFADADDPSPACEASAQRPGGGEPGAGEDRRDREPTGPKESGRLRILFLDDDPGRAQPFLLCRPEAVWVQTAEDCIARLEDPWDEVHLDHDLGGEVFVDPDRPDCGMEVVRWLCNASPARFEKTLFIIHTYNSEAGETMLRCLKERNYAAVYRPFRVDPTDWLETKDPEMSDQEVPSQPPRSTLSEWVRRLSRRWGAARRSPPGGQAADDITRRGGTPGDVPGDRPEPG